MTDQGPSFLPGQPPIRRPGDGLGRVTLPGVNDQEAAPKAPYGMLPGQRHVIPDQIDLDAPSGSPPLPGQGAAPAAAMPVNGWKVLDADGTELADLSMDDATTRTHQKDEVARIGAALVSQATSPEEQIAAKRAMEFGMSQVGGATSTADIKKDMVHRYDVDTNNALAMERQKMKSAARHGGGGVGGGPVGPSKATKFQVSLDENLRDIADKTIESERKGSKYATLSDQENNVSEMERLLSDKNAMSQRVGVQKALLALTGKASRESEQAALTGAAGKWNELANKISLWTSDDPQLTQQYVQQFRGMLKAQRQYIGAEKHRIGQAAAERAYRMTFGYPDDQRQMIRGIVNGAMTGEYPDEGQPTAQPVPAQAAAPGAPPAKPQANPQLKDPYGDL